MPTQSRRRESTRARILAAAKELFLERGFLATSTDAIRIASGIASKETLYRYYSTKEELFVDVLKSITVEGAHLSGLLDGVPEPSSEAELGRMLEEVVRRILTAMLQADYLALMRVTIAELPRFPQLGELFLRTVPSRALGYLRLLLRAGGRTGVARGDRDPEVFARMTVGVLLTYALFDGLFRPGEPAQPPGARQVGEIVDCLVDIVSPRTSGHESAHGGME